MKLCFGTYATVLTLCGAGTTNKDLFEAIFRSVVPEYKFTFVEGSDAAKEDVTSKLRLCKQGLPPEVKKGAKEADEDEVAAYFRKTVMPLIKGDARRLIILALKSIIAEDKLERKGKDFVGIDGTTVIDRVGGVTKKDLAEQTEFCFSEFIAGVFLYVAAEVVNNVGKECVKQIDTAYLDRFLPDVETITLLDEGERAAAIAALRTGRTDTEFGSDMAIDLRMVLNKEQHGHCFECGKDIAVVDSDGKSVDLSELLSLSKSRRRNASLSSSDTILVCGDCKKKLKGITEDKRSELLRRKEEAETVSEAMSHALEFMVQEDVEKLMRELCDLLDKATDDPTVLLPFVGDAHKVEEKIPSSPLRIKVSGLVYGYYENIDQLINLIKDEKKLKADNIRLGMRQAYQNFDATQQKQPEIYIGIKNMLKQRTGSKYRDDAYDVVVSYFVQHCEVFDPLSKEDADEVT
jgi:hypothetical protein